MTSEQLEQQLDRVYGATLSATLAEAVDARVFAAVTNPLVISKRSALGRVRWAVLLAVAAAMLVSVAALGFELFTRILFLPGWQVAWQRSVEIGVEEPVDGGAVRLERGYADANQVVIGWSSTLDRAENLSGDGGIETLTDAAGRNYTIADGAGDETVDGGTINILTFTPVDPPPAGDTTYTLSFPAGPAFTFTLPVVGGTTVSPNLEAVAGGFSLTLTEFRAAPSRVIGALTLRTLADAPDGESWSPIVHLEHDGPGGVIGTGIRTHDVGTIEVFGVAGVDDASGHWTLTITELVGHDGGWPDNQQIRVDGPWVFEFDVP